MSPARGRIPRPSCLAARGLSSSLAASRNCRLSLAAGSDAERARSHVASLALASASFNLGLSDGLAPVLRGGERLALNQATEVSREVDIDSRNDDSESQNRQDRGRGRDRPSNGERPARQSRRPTGGSGRCFDCREDSIGEPTRRLGGFSPGKDGPLQGLVAGGRTATGRASGRMVERARSRARSSRRSDRRPATVSLRRSIRSRAAQNPDSSYCYPASNKLFG